MDLGGASTQIAFAVQEDLTGPDYLHVKLYGYPYNVYTHSFLCYGKNEVEKRILDIVIQVRSFSFRLFCVCVRVQKKLCLLQQVGILRCYKGGVFF